MDTVSSDITHIDTLKYLVAQGEGLHLEFKHKATFPEKVVREMIAFANTKGGRLLIGINDDGSISGLKHPLEESHVLHQALQKCRPPLQFQEQFISINSKRTVICYTIPESLNKPHSYLSDKKEVFVRVSDQSLKASKEMQQIIRRSKRKRDIKFHYGEHEEFLMKYLDEYPFITLEKFVELRKMKRFFASKKFILLVLADILRITPHESGDRYSLAFRQS